MVAGEGAHHSVCMVTPISSPESTSSWCSGVLSLTDSISAENTSEMGVGIWEYNCCVHRPCSSLPLSALNSHVPTPTTPPSPQWNLVALGPRAWGGGQVICLSRSLDVHSSILLNPSLSLYTSPDPFLHHTLLLIFILVGSYVLSHGCHLRGILAELGDKPMCSVCHCPPTPLQRQLLYPGRHWRRGGVQK